MSTHPQLVCLNKKVKCANYKSGLPLQQEGHIGWGRQKTGWLSQGRLRSAEGSLCAETVVELKEWVS